jgi:hypothetical protein
LRGVDGDFIESVGVAFAMREIKPHCQAFVSADKINFFDHAVSQPATSFGEICVLTEADIFGTKDELD